MRDKFELMEALRGVEMKPTAYRVLMTIASYADGNGTNAWPAVSTIAADACMTRRGVQKILRELAADGWLVVVEWGGNQHGHGQSNRYRVVIPKGERRDTLTVAETREGRTGGHPKGERGDTLRANGGSPNQALDQANDQANVCTVGTGPSPARGRERAHEPMNHPVMVAVARPQAAVAAVEARSYADPVVQDGLRWVCQVVGGWTDEDEESRAAERLSVGVPRNHVSGEVQAARDTAAIRAELASAVA